jgi:hypothetical protein
VHADKEPETLINLGKFLSFFAQALLWVRDCYCACLRKENFKMAAAGSRLPQLHKGLNKLTKAERKMMKKQTKALHTLKNRAREVGGISEIPTPYLLVKNGGLMCGVKRQDLVNVFDKCGKLDDLIMIPGKSFSYVLFSDVTSAKEAMKNINGQKLPLNQTSDRTFYLAYLLKRPCAELCLSDRSYPSGMILIEDFISEHLEHKLLQYFSSCKETANSKEIIEMNVPALPGMKKSHLSQGGACRNFRSVHDQIVLTCKCYFLHNNVLFFLIMHLLQGSK